MHRLNGEDSGFLSLELPTQPMTSHFLILLRPPTGPDGMLQPITLEYLADHVTKRLGEIPMFRWRIVPVPLGLHHEMAVEDPAFDIKRHLHRVVAPSPGGPAQLARISDSLAARRLDRRRPLWDMTLVDGLADGRQGLVLQFHHALGDGGPTVKLLERLLSGEDHVPVREAWPWTPDFVPGKWKLLRDALREQPALRKRLPALMKASGRGDKARKALELESSFVPPKSVQDTPACSLNNAFSARRRHGNVTLPMADVMAVKRASGVSVTQVVLGIVAGGLRRYLEGIDDLPDRPLIAGVPMAFPMPGPPREYGNRFINFLTSLATDVDDPWERLQKIKEVSNGSRKAMDAFGGELFCDWADQLPPILTRNVIRAGLKARQRDRSKADISVNVSVLPLTVGPWSVGPAVVEECYMEGPPNSGCGVSITAYGYVDGMSIGIHTCADAVPDPEVMAAGCAEALAELVDLAGARGSGSGDELRSSGLAS